MRGMYQSLDATARGGRFNKLFAAKLAARQYVPSESRSDLQHFQFAKLGLKLAATLPRNSAQENQPCSPEHSASEPSRNSTKPL